MKKAVLFTRHYFSHQSRKTTVHFVARQLATRGYDVSFVSVGRSRLATSLKAKSRIPTDIKRDVFTELEPMIHSIVLDEMVHPLSSRSGLVNCLLSPKTLKYGTRIPSVIAAHVKQADLILIECGYGVAYFDALKAMAPKAKFVYLATDPLGEVGLRPEFEEMENQALPKFDLVRVAAPEFADRFPKDTKSVVIPQGIDKSIFDRIMTSPYPDGSVNLVSVGDMSFDEDSLIQMAQAAPQATLHVFGARFHQDTPANIKVHGEVEFSKLAPYIKFADAGIMPYKLTENMGYLKHTSLKFLQYTYCGLPILTAQGIDWGRACVFTYDRTDAASIHAATRDAIAHGQDSNLSKIIVDWSEVTERLLGAL